MTTIEAICNQALDVIGEKRHIGNILEGSTLSRIALNAWGQTRDSLLDKYRPIWSHKDATLTLLKSAPVGGYGGVPWDSSFPEIPWKYEYMWPTDCIQPLQIKITPVFLPVWRPRAITFRQVFDTPSSNRTLLCDAPQAILTYVAQILDPNDWNVGFIDMMIMELAEKFKVGLAAPAAMQQQRGQNADASS